MLETDEVSRLLDILGNRNRRRIIQLLRQKPCYVTEISDRLMISPKAVIEHLQMMERERLLASHNDDRRRKYYYLSQEFDVVINLEPLKPAPRFITSEEFNNNVKFFNSLSMLRRMLKAREELITNFESLERDIEQKINELMRYGKDIVRSEAETNLIIALLNYDLTFEELEEITGFTRNEIQGMLNSLMAKRIVERTGNCYRARDIYGEYPIR